MKTLLPLLCGGLLIASTSCKKEENLKYMYVDAENVEVFVDRADDGRNFSDFSDQEIFDAFLPELERQIESYRVEITDDRRAADFIMQVDTAYFVETMNREWVGGNEYNLSTIGTSLKYHFFGIREDIPQNYTTWSSTEDKVNNGSKDHKDHKGHGNKAPTVDRTNASELFKDNGKRIKKNAREFSKNMLD